MRLTFYSVRCGSPVGAESVQAAVGRVRAQGLEPAEVRCHPAEVGRVGTAVAEAGLGLPVTGAGGCLAWELWLRPAEEVSDE